MKLSASVDSLRVALACSTGASRASFEARGTVCAAYLPKESLCFRGGGIPEQAMMLIQDNLALTVFCIGCGVIIVGSFIGFSIWSHLRRLRNDKEGAAVSEA